MINQTKARRSQLRRRRVMGEGAAINCEISRDVLS